MRIAEAKKLRPGDYIYPKGRYNADGTPMKARVNGKVQTWVFYPNRIRIPYKHGLYDTGSSTAADLPNFTTRRPANRKKK